MAFIMIWAIQLSAQAPRSPIEMAPVQPEPAPHRLIIRVSKSIASGMTISSIGTSSTSIQKIPKTGITSIDKLLKDNGAKEITKSFNFQPQSAFSAARIDAKTRRIQEIEDKLNRTYIVEFPSTVNLDSLKNQLKSNPDIESVHKDVPVTFFSVPNDPLWNHWGHQNTRQLRRYDEPYYRTGSTDTYGAHIGVPVGQIGFDAGAPQAWDTGYGNPNIIIAILDTGVAPHPDLRLVQGYNFDSNSTNTSDAQGHGTACAGVAAAIANNGIGVAGIAGGCSVMPMKGSTGFSVPLAITYAVDHGASVIRMSFGFTGVLSIEELDLALERAYLSGVVLVAATGNDNYNFINYPASSPYVIAVGAASPDGGRKRPQSEDGEYYSRTRNGQPYWGSDYGVNQRDAAGATDILGPTILTTTDIPTGE